MELKQNEIEFSHKSWWDDNKMLIGAVLAVAICCGLAGVTIYYTYSFAAENLASASANVADLAQAVREALTING